MIVFRRNLLTSVMKERLFLQLKREISITPKPFEEHQIETPDQVLSEGLS